MNWENLGQNILIWAAQFGMKRQFVFLKSLNGEEAFAQASASGSGTSSRMN